MTNGRGDRRAGKLGTERGSVLIVTLWALFFLGALAVAVNAYVASNLSVAAKIRNRAELLSLAKAGLRLSSAKIAFGVKDSYEALNESWNSDESSFKKVAVGENGEFSLRHLASDKPGTETYVYGLIDEERKININKASQASLRSFFEVMTGMTSQEAADIAGAIVDWRDKDEDLSEGGAESGYYRSLDPSYACANADFRTLDELLLVKGITAEIFNKTRDRLTVYGTGMINVNTADEVVLQCMGIHPSITEKMVRFRKGRDGLEGTTDDGIFKSAATVVEDLNSVETLSPEESGQLRNALASGSFDVRSENFMGNLEAQLKNGRDAMKVTFVVDRTKAIKYWSEA